MTEPQRKDVLGRVWSVHAAMAYQHNRIRRLERKAERQDGLDLLENRALAAAKAEFARLWESLR